MSLRRTWPLMGGIILAAICILLAISIVNSIDYRNNDFFTFWLAGHMVAKGENPYAPAQWVAGHQEFQVTWIPNQAFVYPLPLSWLFIPLGWLPLYQAFIAWVALSILMILVSITILIKLMAGSRSVVIPLVAGLIFFRPTILTLFRGQISGWLLLLLILTAYLWEKSHWEWGSLLLAFLILKPNLGVPLVFLLGIWLLYHRHFRAILVIVAGLLALLIIGLLQNPHWVTDYWAIGNLKVAQNFGGAPTIWGLVALPCRNGPTCMLAMGGPVSLLLVLTFFWLTVRRPNLSPLQAVALAVTITLLVTPYTWTYDQLLLLIPIAFVSLEMVQKKKPFLLASSLFIGIDLLVLILLVFDTLLNAEILNVFVPITILGLWFWNGKDHLPSPA